MGRTEHAVITARLRLADLEGSGNTSRDLPAVRAELERLTRALLERSLHRASILKHARDLHGELDRLADTLG
ncbi:MAG TPA: hypothetical protein VNT60_03495 [Deinococcales bacterium]|nr:hypothetical protein [Deinococcales bacterium]